MFGQRFSAVVKLESVILQEKHWECCAPVTRQPHDSKKIFNSLELFDLKYTIKFCRQIKIRILDINHH